MKNVCFCVGDLSSSGGTERVTSIIANNLSTQNYNVSILSFSGGGESFFTLNEDIEIHSLYSKNVSFKKMFIATTHKIRKFVKLNQIDTLIVVDSILCLFTIPALYNLKTYHICWEHFNFNVDLGMKSRRLSRVLSARYCDHVVTLTSRDKLLWEKNLNNIRASISAIANPTTYINVENTPRLSYKTVLAIGHLNYQKGFNFLIEAWAIVCKHNEDWMLKIIGNGKDEKSLKDQAKSLGVYNRIEFIPATKNIEKYYRTSSFYCMSSRFEGLPMVLLEAQSFGLPMIAFDCETGPDEVIIENYNGSLVKPFDIEGLAFSLLKMLNLDKDKYELMCKNSQENSKKYEIDPILADWMLIINDKS